MSDVTCDYSLCGWRLASAIPLPELGPWDGDERAPEVRFVVGDVPASLGATLFETPIAQVGADGRIRFEIDGIAAYLVEDGNHVTIAPQMALDAPDIRLFLLGTGLGYLCHQRGLVPIHAASVEIDGRAVMLAGSSGAGKSTLASAFARRGFPVLSDDVAPLTLAGPARILPSLRRIRLWRDSAHHAGWSEQDFEPCREDLAKFTRALGNAHADRALEPAALFHLHHTEHGSDEIRFDRLRGAVAVSALRQQIYRWRALVGLETPARALHRAGAAAERIPRHFELRRPIDFRRLDDTIEAIVETVRAEA